MARHDGVQFTIDDELRVLWLTRYDQELALSSAGIWLHSGRREAELVWAEIDQVQATPHSVFGSARWLRVEVFTKAGTVHTIGPFPAPPAERWLAACAETVRQQGGLLMPLDGSPGFALGATAP